MSANLTICFAVGTCAHGMTSHFAMHTLSMALQAWHCKIVTENAVKYVAPCRWLLWHLGFTKFSFGQDSVLSPTGRAYGSPLDPQVD